jgi:GNAT superfamily N-acetyltransferase
MKLGVPGVEIIGKRKRVVRIQSAVVRVAAFFGLANGNHDSHWMLHTRKRCSAILSLAMDSPTPVIREITPEDALAAANLSGELGYQTSAEAIRKRIETLLARPDQAIYVACLSGNVIGWIDLAVTYHLAADPRVEIQGLVVSAKVRSRGIGRLLVERAEQWARSRGLTAMLVRSRVTREDAHRFYLREGYTRIKTSAVFTKELS